MRYITSLFIIALAVTPLSFVSAHEETGGHMMDFWGHGGWFGFGGWFTMILIWLILILGIVALVKAIMNDKK